MKNSVLRTRIVPAVALAAGLLAVWFLLPGGEAGAEAEPAAKDAAAAPEDLYPVEQYGWHSFYMRQMFTRYADAKKYFDQGNLEVAEANVAVMRLFADQVLNERTLLSKQKVGEEKKDQCCQDTVSDLNAKVQELRGLIKGGKWFDVPAGGKDPMFETCGQCHLEYGVPADVLDKPDFTACSVGQREVYELFVLLGYYMKAQKWDDARSIVIVLKPHVEALKDNIPDKNKAGETIDKDKYLRSYQEIKQYTDDLDKRLETKNFEGGKPLPPPRLVVSICSDCHAAAGNLPMPW